MKTNIKKGFTIVEVSILFVIFLIVALLVIPLSLDDTIQTNSLSRWRNVQTDFANMSYAIDTQRDNKDFNYNDVFMSVMKDQSKTVISPYKITFKNGTFPSRTYRFQDYNLTYTNAVFAYKLFPESEDGILGIIMYDVNGQKGPNVWGRDVFGYNVYEDKFEPFCKNDSQSIQEQDCSKSGTGLCCSSYYLSGGRVE